MWKTFTDYVVDLGESSAAIYDQVQSAGQPAPASAPAAPAATKSPAWLIPALIGGVLLLIGAIFMTRK